MGNFFVAILVSSLMCLSGCGPLASIGENPEASGDSLPTPTPSASPKPNQVPPYKVKLVWDPNKDNTAGYYVYYRSDSEPEPVAKDVSSATEATITLSKPGKYTFYATAYNNKREESGPSSEVTTTLPWPDGVYIP